MGTIRLSGMISGLDTDAIVKELMNAQKLKNKKVSDKLTLSEWKEEKWKELNSKLYKLYADDLSKLRLQGNYMTKKVTSSNSNLLEVTGNANAIDGAHTVTITSLASAQYVTSGKLSEKVLTGNTSLKELLDAKNISEFTPSGNPVIQISHKGKEKTLVVTDKTTINDFINSCKEVGLNANFDSTMNRIFISSKESGKDNSFTIKSEILSTDGVEAYNNIKTAIGTANLSTAERAAVTDALNILKGSSNTEIDTLYKAYIGDSSVDLNTVDENKLNAFKILSDYAKSNAEKAATTSVKNEIKTDLLKDVEGDTETQKINTYVRNHLLEQKAAELGLPVTDSAVIEAVNNYYNDNKISQSDINNIFNTIVDDKYNSDEQYKNKVKNQVNNSIIDLTTNISNYVSSASSSNVLSVLGLGEINGSKVDATNETSMTVVAAANAEVNLDGAIFTASTNSITVNGMTLNLKGISNGEKISVSISNDTQAVYDMVKNFITSYNTILKEMNTLYYAGSARGYDPLSDEEKEAMTEDQIKKWENKIKDSILRRDTSLGSVIEGMKSAMMSTVTIGDKRYSLSSFGITTSSDYTEKGLLHIYGNKDDATFADQADKLMAALTNDPDNATSALSQIFGKLYDTMYDKMKAIPNVRSIYTFYNDKLMDSEQTKYKKQISQLEVKLKDMEDKYYKQFTAMEKAMARLQQQSSYLAGMLGTSSK